MTEITEYPDFDGEDAKLPRYKGRAVLFLLGLEGGRMTNKRIEDRYNINSKHLHHLKNYQARMGQDRYPAPIVEDVEFENGSGVELTEAGWKVLKHETELMLSHQHEGP